MLTTDGREVLRSYEGGQPMFGTAPEALLQGMAEMPGLEVHVISCLQQRPVSSPKQLASNIWFHALHVPKLGWLRTGYQGCIRAVRRKLKEIQPELVHGQGTERDCAISAVLSGYPNILTIHGNVGAIVKLLKIPLLSYYGLVAQLERWTIPRSDGVVCISRYTEALVASRARRTWLLPNAVDQDFFSIRHNPVNPPQILCVASIDERKNQIRLLEALGPIAAQVPLRVLFYGVAPARDPYAARFLQMLKERSWCEHGFADRKTLRAALESATMLVLPSLEENCPMSVLEAMAGGVPVVAGRVGGIPDLFEEGVSGLFCDPLDVQSIRAAIQKVLTDRAVAARIGSHGRQRALERFHPKVIARQHLEIYHDLLSRRSPRQAKPA